MGSSIPMKELRNERIELIPFSPDKHIPPFLYTTISHPELFDHVPFGPFTTPEEFTTEFLQPRIFSAIGSGLYAIYDKVNLDRGPNENEDKGNNGSFAGTIGFLNASPSNLQVELGFIIIIPKFQRTHVASNAIGLLLHSFLDLPTYGGLGMRRVVWKPNSMNSASIHSAERMGFTKECIMRWDRVWDERKGRKIGNGRSVRKGDPKEGSRGRDTVMLSLCWEEWEDGMRDKVGAVMKRLA